VEEAGDSGAVEGAGRTRAAASVAVPVEEKAAAAEKAGGDNACSQSQGRLEFRRRCPQIKGIGS
jgi:hypothetical protein